MKKEIEKKGDAEGWEATLFGDSTNNIGYFRCIS
jgi:hypothetical protein